MQPSNSTADLRLCSLADLDVEDESVDLILTDPPYPREFLPVWGDLADLALRALRPGGSLVAMSGNQYLPDVIRHLDRPGLDFMWTLCCLTPGSNGRHWDRRMYGGWKPILWYAKGKARPRKMREDRIVSRPDKRFHHWGQDIHVFEELIGSYSRHGQLVCDPFLGGGTTAVAARLNGRRFIGCDVDATCITSTQERLRAVEEYLATERARIGVT